MTDPATKIIITLDKIDAFSSMLLEYLLDNDAHKHTQVMIFAIAHEAKVLRELLDSA